MKKKIWLAGLMILTVGLWSNFCFAAYKTGSEPDGFRGIKWGTDISTLSGMRYLGTDPSWGGIKGYTRKNEALHLGSAKLKRIEYNFWRGKFFSVWVITQGYTNWAGLRDAVFEKYGKGYQDNKYIEYYRWLGSVTGMGLQYNEISERGELYMFSKEIDKQQKAYQKQKAKEGAETGF